MASYETQSSQLPLAHEPQSTRPIYLLSPKASIPAVLSFTIFNHQHYENVSTASYTHCIMNTCQDSTHTLYALFLFFPLSRFITRANTSYLCERLGLTDVVRRMVTEGRGRGRGIRGRGFPERTGTWRPKQIREANETQQERSAGHRLGHWKKRLRMGECTPPNER